MTLQLHSRDDFTLESYRRVAWGGEGVRFSGAAMETMAYCRVKFEELIEDPDVVVYGVTSGYGQMAHLRFTPEERKAHGARPSLAAASSFGEPLPDRVARGVAFARLANFVEGNAAISTALAAGAAEQLDQKEQPAVPALGNGCPGEIEALAHLYGPLMERHQLKEKDSLSLINGSPCATALLSDAALAARGRVELATAIFALSAEAMNMPLGHVDPALDDLWGDPEERAVLEKLRGLMDMTRGDARRAYQAPVSWRIMPRVLAQALRATKQAEQAARTALKAVTDNPVYIPPDEAHPRGRAISTGGYHNAAAYPALDNLAAAWADLALLCDRQVTKLLTGGVSHLPNHLTGKGGGYIGCTGFTAAGYAEQARYAAQRTFLPGSEGGGFGQNDVAVPTFHAWRKDEEAGRCLEAGMACLAHVASQAFHVTDRKASGPLAKLINQVRDLAPVVDEPRALGPELEALSNAFRVEIYS